MTNEGIKIALGIIVLIEAVLIPYVWWKLSRGFSKANKS